MDYRNASDEQLVRTIGGGAMPGAMAFEGCQAELNRRLAEKSVNVATKALWISGISAFAALFQLLG